MNNERLAQAAAEGTRIGRPKPGRPKYTKTEAELALERLLDRHQKWLMVQPELLLLWTQDRYTRRRVAHLLGSALLTIPFREMTESTPPNRAMRRAIFQELERADREWFKGVEQ